MASIELPTLGVQIKLAAPVTASTALPQLEVKSYAVINPHELRLRMACSQQECLPFFAQAIYPESFDIGQLEHKPSAGRNGDGGLAIKADASAAPLLETPQKVRSSAPSLRAGAPVILNIDGGRIHICLQVICLQSGSIGDKVRVSTPDRKQSYVAQIVTSDLVKGEL